jgi:flagellar hook-length control protein FliK
MPNIDFNQLSALPITELAFPELVAPAAADRSAQLFNDYLKRADFVSKSVPAAPAPKSQSADHPPSRKTDSPSRSSDRTDRTPKSPSSDAPAAGHSPAASETGRPAGDAAAPSPDQTQQAQDDAFKTAPKDANDGESPVSASDNDSVKDRKKAKGEKKDESTEAVTAELRKEASGLPVAAEANAQNDRSANDNNAEQLSAEAAVAQVAADPGEANAAPTSEKSAGSRGKVAAPMEKPEQNPDAAANEWLALDGTSHAVDDSDGKTKTKKTRTAADARNPSRPQKSAARTVDASSTDDAKAASVTVSNGSPDAVPASSAASPSAAILPTVLEALKNADKPTASRDSVSAVADLRTASPTASKTAAAREGSSSATTNGSDAPAHVARAQFVQRVERAFAAMGNREGSVRLKLSPPELGVLKLEIGIHRGVMKARVEAETPAAQSLLLDNLPALRERLAQQNIHIQQFDVDLMDRQPGGTPQQAFDQSGSGGQHGGRSAPPPTAAEIASNSPISPAASQRAGMGGGLNVIV